MNIRRGRAEDLGAVVALERQSPAAAHWPESSYSAILEAGDTARISLVAEDAGVIRGFLIARIIGHECELENIVVANGDRRGGLGSKLIRALAGAARDREATNIFLEVRESNVAARSFYAACGFSSDGCRRSYYNDPVEDAVLYALAM
jgi:ribosomal-protein-alanine N-acetyltransferase